MEFLSGLVSGSTPSVNGDLGALSIFSVTGLLANIAGTSIFNIITVFPGSMDKTTRPEGGRENFSIQPLISLGMVVKQTTKY